jgi:hypothetical protein
MIITFLSTAKLDFSSMPPEVLKILSPVIPQLANKALDNKDYESFEALIKISFQDQSYTTYADECIDRVDLKAVEIATKYLSEEEKSEFLTRIYKRSASYHLDIGGKIILYDELKEFHKNACKLIVTSMKTFKASDLQIISSFFTKAEFEELITKNNIDLNDEAYKGLELEHYKLEEKSPLSAEISANNSIVIEALLTRTYSETLSQDEVRKIYHNLVATNDSIITKVMQYCATTILDGSSNIRIIFEPGVTSSFVLSKNIIKVNTDNHSEFNILGLIFIHELSHYFFNQIYKSGALPFNIGELRELTFNNVSTQDSNEEIITSILKPFAQLFSLKAIKSFLDHKRAELSFVNKAGELLGCATNQFLEIENVMSNKGGNDPIVEFAKFECPEIILMPGITGTIFSETNSLIANATRTSSIGISLDNFISCTQLYNKHSHSYPRSYFEAANPVCPNLTFEEMITQIEAKFLPAIISQRGLDSHDLYFISRVADWANRGNSIYHSTYNNFDSQQRQVELMVRLPEMVAAGLKPSLVSALQPMVDFWNTYVMPDIDSALALYQAKCSDPANNMPCLGETVEMEVPVI